MATSATKAFEQRKRRSTCITIFFFQHLCSRSFFLSRTMCIFFLLSHHFLFPPFTFFASLHSQCIGVPRAGVQVA